MTRVRGSGRQPNKKKQLLLQQREMISGDKNNGEGDHDHDSDVLCAPTANLTTPRRRLHSRTGGTASRLGLVLLAAAAAAGVQSPPGSPSEETTGTAATAELTADLSTLSADNVDIDVGDGNDGEDSDSGSWSSKKKRGSASSSSALHVLQPLLVKDAPSAGRSDQSCGQRQQQQQQQQHQEGRIERAAAALDAAGHKHLEANRIDDALESYRRALKLKRRMLSGSNHRRIHSAGGDNTCNDDVVDGPAVHREEAMLDVTANARTSRCAQQEMAKILRMMMPTFNRQGEKRRYWHRWQRRLTTCATRGRCWGWPVRTRRSMPTGRRWLSSGGFTC